MKLSSGMYWTKLELAASCLAAMRTALPTAAPDVPDAGRARATSCLALSQVKRPRAAAMAALRSMVFPIAIRAESNTSSALAIKAFHSLVSAKVCERGIG